MFHKSLCVAVALAISGSLVAASAQTPAPSKMKWTREHLKEMKVKWSQNRGKLKACRKDVRSKGLVGDARWFFMEDCMEKS